MKTTKAGEQLLISISTSAIKNDDGKVVGGVEMFRDLSQVVELPKKLSKSYVIEDMVTKNQKMQMVLEQLPLFAASSSTVLIEGASGTGKELIAQALHNLGPRSKYPFITVNCAALPDSLLESELFGYVKGAFTDARKDKPGRFQLAQKGSILLDEIGNISMAMQAKLLRVIQQRELEPLGATSSVKIDVRVIAATNRNLAEDVKRGNFRDNLFYRLNVIYINLPPLSQRREDIPLLVDYFISRFNLLQGKAIERISERALAALIDAPLQGNIRELENAIEHAFVICDKRIIDLQHLPPQYAAAASEKIDMPSNNPFDAAEAEIIRGALKPNNNNRTKAAKDIGISRNTIWRKMKRFGLML
ncbi:MAG: sigma 54-interacting transcriptional regulator [Candidatus Riflebacteria bacterium]|nr:sigma 54-interacting transcriptional regulator [Candidatus Riflebacteria bacterium]